MYCQQCGKEIPSGSPTCPACGFNAMLRHSSKSSTAESLDAAVAGLKRSAKELAQSAATLSRRVADEAGKAAKDPSGSAKRGTRKVAEELDKAASEIERILRDL